MAARRRPKGERRRPPGPPPARKPSRLAISLLLAVVGGGGAFLLLRDRGPEPPNPDLADAEPAVAEAVRRARTAVLATPDSGERRGALGAVFLAHELHEAAALAYRQAGRLAPDDYRWSYLEARSLWRLDPAAAEEAALAAIRKNPDYAPARLLAGQLAEDRADPDTALARYREAIDRLGAGGEPANTAALLFRAGRMLAGRNDFRAALPLLERAAALAPESGAIAAALARVYRRTGAGHLARKAAGRARGLEHDMVIADPLMNAVQGVAVSIVGRERRAFAAEGAGRPEVAERLLREMIRTRPDSADLYYNLGNNLSRQGRNEEALTAWQSALDRNPDHVSALVNSAIVLAQSGNRGEAARRCRRALEVHPNHSGALSSLGSVAALDGRRDEAISWFRRSLEQEPGRAGTHDSIAQVLAANREFVEAIRHFRIAVAAEPFRADYRLGLAATLASTGDFAGAWEVAHEGERLDAPLPPDFLRMLAGAMPEPPR